MTVASRDEQVSDVQYDKLRDEVVARLGWQQDLVHYILILAGSLPAILSDVVRAIIGAEILPFVLLGGTMLSLFMLGSMLKQHIYMNLITSFASSELGRDLPFRPWAAYLARQLYSTWRRKILLSALIGAWEFLVPLAVSVLYLCVSWITAQHVYATHQTRILYAVAFHALVCVVIFTIFALIASWFWLTGLVASSSHQQQAR
jgi:hypothetical protein